MDKLKSARTAFNRNLPILAGVCLCLYFSYHTVSGERSFSRLSELNQVSLNKGETLDSLKMQSSSLEQRVSMMRPATLSADMMEEQIRSILGYQHADELAIMGN